MIQQKLKKLTYPQIRTRWKELLDDPLNIPRRALRINTLWWGAEKIIESVFKYKKIAIQSGHSLSKDWSAGIIVLIWLLKYFGQGKVILTAPTDRQVREVMFGEIEKQYKNFCQLHSGFRLDALTGTKLNFGNQCFALGFTTRETSGMVGKFQGFKSPNLLIIISEAQAVDSSVFKQIRGLMTSANSKIIELGNPLVEYGDFYDHCTEPRYNYHVIKLSCFDSPNVIAGKCIIPGMVEKEYIDMMRDELGEDDPEYQSRVLGEFPQQSTHAWIPLAKIRAAVNRCFEGDDALKVGGLDTARKGEDESVHCILRGRTQIKQDCFRKVLTPETVGWARGLIQLEKLEGFAIDEGYNPGIIDWLDFERMPTMAINFGAESPDDRFENLGTFMWYLLRNAFLNDNISIISDPVLVSQLAKRKVELTPRGKRKLESKNKSKEKSPDRADALAMAWYMRYCLRNERGFEYSQENIDNSAASLHDMISHIMPGEKVIKTSEVEHDAANLEANDLNMII